jgi:hypothetical protein
VHLRLSPRSWLKRRQLSPGNCRARSARWTSTGLILSEALQVFLHCIMAFIKAEALEHSSKGRPKCSATQLIGLLVLVHLVNESHPSSLFQCPQPFLEVSPCQSALHLLQFLRVTVGVNFLLKESASFANSVKLSRIYPPMSESVACKAPSNFQSQGLPSIPVLVVLTCSQQSRELAP